MPEIRRSWSGRVDALLARFNGWRTDTKELQDTLWAAAKHGIRQCRDAMRAAAEVAKNDKAFGLLTHHGKGKRTMPKYVMQTKAERGRLVREARKQYGFPYVVFEDIHNCAEIIQSDEDERNFIESAAPDRRWKVRKA
jgi:hypothetical protein